MSIDPSQFAAFRNELQKLGMATIGSNPRKDSRIPHTAERLMDRFGLPEDEARQKDRELHQALRAAGGPEKRLGGGDYSIDLGDKGYLRSPGSPIRTNIASRRCWLLE